MNREEGKRVRAIDRRQSVLRPVQVDKLVEPDHPVRAIWALLEQLELGRFYEPLQAIEGEAGRPAHDPQLLISLWIYGYSQGVSSAREIARRCEYEPGYQWLTGLQLVNYHSLSDFRTRHELALDELFTQLLGVLSAEGLVTLERVMHDGTKVRACASADTFRSEERLRQYLDLARQQVEQLKEQGEEECSLRQRRARERVAEEKQHRLESALEQLQKLDAAQQSKKEKRVSHTDPEARIMKHADGAFAPSYNVQLSTDQAHSLIVEYGVSQNSSDYGLVEPSVAGIEQRLEHAPNQMVVDAGYIRNETIVALEQQGIDLIGPLPQVEHRRRGLKDGAFGPEAFVYQPESNSFVCPAGKTLRYRGREHQAGATRYRYKARTADCQSCPFKPRCCPDARQGRWLMRLEEFAAVRAFRQKMETPQANQIYKQRGAIAEFTNAWIKTKLGLRQFRLQGLRKVSLEVCWACLTYNIQQWIRLSWRPKLAAAIA